VIYLFGAGWLALLYGFEKALALGVLPFLVGDALKLLVAALALPLAWKFTQQPIANRSLPPTSPRQEGFAAHRFFPSGLYFLQYQQSF